MSVLIIIVLAIAAAIFYRMGGSGNYPRWVRPVGVSACLILGMLARGYFDWWLILCFGIQYGAVTTYFKKKGTDAKWWNWLLVGIASSAAILPVVINSGDWLSFAVRGVVLTAGTVLWSQFIGHAVVEELGRGALIILSLLMLTKRKDKK